MKTICRYLTILVCATALLACGGGGGGGGGGGTANARPEIVILKPEQDTAVLVGTHVTISFIADDPDSIATTDVLADIDGDISTLADQVVIKLNIPEANGATHNVFWDTSSVAPATYWIMVVSDDRVNTPTVEKGVRCRIDSGFDLVVSSGILWGSTPIRRANPVDPDYWNLIANDPWGDVADGELDLQGVWIAQNDTDIEIHFEVNSTQPQSLFQENVRYGVSFLNVVLNGQEGTFWIQKEGAGEPGGESALFAPGSATSGSFLGFSVTANTTATGRLTLRVAREHFAFGVLDDALASFTVVAWVERKDTDGVVQSLDTSQSVVIDFRD